MNGILSWEHVDGADAIGVTVTDADHIEVTAETDDGRVSARLTTAAAASLHAWLSLALTNQPNPRPGEHHLLGEPGWIDDEQQYRVGCACGEVYGGADEQTALDLHELHTMRAC